MGFIRVREGGGYRFEQPTAGKGNAVPMMDKETCESCTAAIIPEGTNNDEPGCPFFVLLDPLVRAESKRVAAEALKANGVRA